jgi:transposase-like protein
VTENSEMLKLYREHDVILLLNRLVSEGTDEIKPVLDPAHGFRYPEVEKLIGGTTTDAVNLIEKLANAGILEKKFFDKIIYCPSCKSANIAYRYVCPICRDAHIDLKALFEHIPCGYTDIEDRFKQDDKLVCPRCHVELKKLGVNYKRVRSGFECMACKKRFDDPLTISTCRNCGTTFTIKEADFADVHSYVLSANAKAELQKGMLFLTRIRGYLEKEGYSVEIPGYLEGASGATHRFDMVASDTKLPIKNALVIDVALSDTIVEEHPVISLFAKNFDTGTSPSIMVAVPKLSESGKKLAELYKINVIEATDMNEAVTKLYKIIKAVR